MRILYLIFIFAFLSLSVKSQTVNVSGDCMTGTIVLSPVADVAGKAAYEGTGTVLETDNVQVAVFWIGDPDNVWVLAFDGQPYFQNSCGTDLPWGTENASCPWEPVSETTCTGAAPLIINGSGALVVKLISFTANVDNKLVSVKWKTATESNNKGFYIQRSADGNGWSDIGFVAGNGNSTLERTYQFSDLRPLKGKNFYRLRQVDLDGRSYYSAVVAVNFISQGMYSIYGNPGKGIYQLNMEPSGEKLELSVIDATGKRILTKVTSAGVQTIDITNSPAGIYLLRIRKGTYLITEKLVKF